MIMPGCKQFHLNDTFSNSYPCFPSALAGPSQDVVHGVEDRRDLLDLGSIYQLEFDDPANGPHCSGARIISKGLQQLEIDLGQVLVDGVLESLASVGGCRGRTVHLGCKLFFQLEHQ